ncbi:MAG: hypothetical protein K1X68_02245 [Saprospiraceae bacterium]|nr:hypothetical protein [Saprospiraceae bacterium]HMW38831.1 hypothetical protein [Saprospiraceae bacterium]HMX89381.1 hypothetical protein [Saprospiraceae bacterium]HMZ40820.1 hypothetical protein [Saprospiraceae bacterium]HNA63588.1 hypothetical protein [Saprospiraceae bacterium]
MQKILPLSCNTILYILTIIFIFNCCQRDNPSWNIDVLAPIAKGKLRISDIAPDSLYKADSSGLAHLYFERALYNLSVDSFFAISDTTVAKSFAIDSLRLYTLNIQYPLTLGAIARQSGPVGALILALHGSTFAIPAIGPLSVPPVDLNADTLFTSMTLDDGKIDVRFENNLPVDITDVRFVLKNANNGLKLLEGNFPIIRANTAESQTFSLSGLTVESKLTVEVSNFSSPGSGGKPVLVDTSNSIIAALKVYDLRPSKATAVWPAQNIIEQYLDFNLRRLSVKLKFAKIKSGKVYLKLLSTIDDTLHFYYSLPGAVKNGKGFDIRKDLAPGTTLQPSAIYEEYDFSGYDLDLSGSNKDTFNATPNSIIVSIDSTGIQKTFSKADNILVELGFKDLKPSYAKGYLGMDTFTFGPNFTSFDFLKDLNGKFKFSDIQLNVDVENKIGADGSLIIGQVAALNTITGQQLSLTSSELNKPLGVSRASDQNGFPPILPGKTSLQLDKTNSNINDCVSILPDQLNYALTLITNPNGNVSDYRDFVYDGQLLDIRLKMDVPLHFSIENCSLLDTSDLNTSGLNLQNAIEGKLYLKVENEFPLDSDMEIKFEEQAGLSQALLEAAGRINAAEIVNGDRTTGSKTSIIEIPVTQDQVNKLKKAHIVIFKTRFNTRPDNRQVKIFDDYAMKLSLTADLKYKID